MRIHRAVLYVVILGILLTPMVALSVTITGIRIVNEGAGPLDEGAVRARIGLKVGDEFNANAASRDVKTLKETGRYSYVSVNITENDSGVVVIYGVVSRPRIRKLHINGAQDFTNKKIKTLMGIEIGDRVDDVTLAVSTQKVVDEYRKKYYPEATLTAKIEEDAESGSADVTIVVDEGKRAKVKKVMFSGDIHVPTRQLRKVMAQKQLNILSWITGSGVYSPSDVTTDRIAVRRVFLDRGYLDAEIGEPEITPLRGNKLVITLPITEGRSYTMGEITSDGITLFESQEVMGRVMLNKGDVASMAEIEKARQAVKDYYGFRGYVDTEVEMRLDALPETRKVDLHFVVSEGKITYIRNIEIEGNTRTKDHVIRRELAVYPGDVYNQVRVRTSEARLRNTGFFEYVNSTPRPTAKSDHYDVVYEVAEQRTGQFVVGAGFSSIDDVIGFVELQQGNFDIGAWPSFTGGGQKLKARFTVGTSRRDWQLNFVEPWFLNRKLSLGLDLFQHDRRFLSDDYDQRNTGGSIALGKELAGPFRGNLKYTFQEIDVDNIDEFASESIKVEEGARTKSSVTPELIFDTRNNVFIPSRGNRTEFATTLAGGPLGGETDLVEVSLRSSQYWSVMWDHVLSLRARATAVEEYDDAVRVPIFDRLFLGGARSLRGFKFREVGPRDEQGEPIGGKSSGFVSLEYTVPLVEKIRWAAFYDAGFVNVDSWDFSLSDYNSDVGTGVRLDIPGFPLQLDYAWPLEADDFNDTSSGRFNFLIGYLF